MKTHFSRLFLFLSYTFFINIISFANDYKYLSDSIQKTDTIYKQNNNTLLGKISYEATDTTSISPKNKLIRLYNNAKINYQDMEITSGIIIVDYDKNEIYAGRLKDSLGEYSQLPIFKQGQDEIRPDSLKFNMDTKKAIIFNSRTEEAGLNILSDKTKKENDSVYYMDRAKFTTSADIDNPEYYFLLRKAKVIPGKKIITGPTNMYIADVPTPIGLPFAYFPISNKRSSGIIFPSFGEQNSRGYFVQNGGYYLPINDNLDLTLLGDYYTNGSYGFRVENTYLYRYRFRGNLSFRFENLIQSERGFPDYSKSSIYNLRWSHSQDSKSNPNSRFSASVNLGSSKYYQQSINQMNAANFLNNSLSSSISYSKTFPGEPQVNMSVSATHSQNTNTQAINMTLPTLQGSISRVYPFAPKVGTKKGIIQNINFQYNLRGENRILTSDSLFFKKEMFESAKTGLQHSIPISTNFKLLKYFSFSTSANFQETWVFKTINKDYDIDLQEVITNENRGFDSFRTYNFSTSLGTTIYGMYNFSEENKLRALRHVMRPSISYGISPSFDKYYDTYEVVSADGLTTSDIEYSRFEGSIFGLPNKNYASSIAFSLNNNIEAKVVDKESEEKELKKVVILNNLNFSTSYNLAADSLKLSPIRMNGGTQLFKNKMNVNFGATLDPYALDENNNRIDDFQINRGGGLFRLTSANLTFNYAFSSDSSEKKSDRNQKSIDESVRNGGRDDDLFGRAMDTSTAEFSKVDDEKKEKTPNDLYNYKIPWSLRMAYAVNYNNNIGQNEISSHSLMFSGDIEISPKWSAGFSSGYDFKNQGITYTQLRFERDLLSWRMNFSWIPFSANKSWNFFIGIKSGMLSDIKYDKRRQRDKIL
ncbi:MAG: organic solvent tolerance protein OstA [Flavobacteriaceae bacterium]|nr:organic solvent tolerance protein OstA [Flavobacteriaceae bacterium]